MIKIVQDNKVIDVVKYPRYVKFLSPERIALTNKALAQGVASSDNTKVYSYAPVEAKTAGVVTAIEICQEEYEYLEALLKTTDSISADKLDLAKTKSRVIDQLSDACKKAITEGFSVTLSDGDTHDFRLTTEDQLNLLMLENRLNAGEKHFIYHETDKPCTIFSKADITKILAAFHRHVSFHTTYFNAAKHYIKAQVDVDKVRDFVYGNDIIDIVADKDTRRVLETGGNVL